MWGRGRMGRMKIVPPCHFGTIFRQPLHITVRNNTRGVAFWRRKCLLATEDAVPPESKLTFLAGALGFGCHILLDHVY